MDEHDWLAERFEEQRGHLRAVAYRMLGSLSEADDAVQEARLRLSRADTSNVENLGGWLTTVVGRVSLDMLRSRTSRREEALGGHVPERVVSRLERGGRREGVGGRGGADLVRDAELTRQRDVIDAFLAAARGGDFQALLAVLDPDVVLRADSGAVPAVASREVHGAAAVAKSAAKGRARAARPALVNGEVGVVVAPRGRLLMVLGFTISDGKIVEIDAIGDPEQLSQLDLTLLDD